MGTARSSQRGQEPAEIGVPCQVPVPIVPSEVMAVEPVQLVRLLTWLVVIEPVMLAALPLMLPETMPPEIDVSHEGVE